MDIVKIQQYSRMEKLKQQNTQLMPPQRYIFGESDSEFVLIQPVDDHDIGLLENEVKTIKRLTARRFMLVGFKIDDWNSQLSPWCAPPVFGKTPFGDGAQKTLDYILRTLLPDILHGADGGKKVIIGGYSLAGLFALWCGYQTDRFYGVAAASPSVWFPNWIDFAEDNIPRTRSRSGSIERRHSCRYGRRIISYAG